MTTIKNTFAALVIGGQLIGAVALPATALADPLDFSVGPVTTPPVLVEPNVGANTGDNLVLSAEFESGDGLTVDGGSVIPNTLGQTIVVTAAAGDNVELANSLLATLGDNTIVARLEVDGTLSIVSGGTAGASATGQNITLTDGAAALLQNMLDGNTAVLATILNVAGAAVPTVTVDGAGSQLLVTGVGQLTSATDTAAGLEVLHNNNASGLDLDVLIPVVDLSAVNGGVIQALAVGQEANGTGVPTYLVRQFGENGDILADVSATSLTVDANSSVAALLFGQRANGTDVEAFQVEQILEATSAASRISVTETPTIEGTISIQAVGQGIFVPPATP